MESFIKLVLNIIFVPFFWFFSYIIPKKKNLILAGSRHGYRFTGNPKFFYLYIIQNKIEKIDIFWITRDKTVYKMLKNDKKPVVYLYSISGFWSLLRAQYLVVEIVSQDVTGRTFLLGNFNIIQTWHGSPLKNISHDESKDNTLYKKIFWFFIKQELKLYSVVLTASFDQIKIMEEALRNDNVQVLGYPRNDIFFDKKYQVVNYKKELFLENYNKIILYAPTFRDGTVQIFPFSENFLYQLNDFLKEKNFIFLIKCHPAFLLGEGIKISKFSNIKDISFEVDDIQDILVDVDTLIVDYSSVMFDFVLTKRPIIFYCYDYDNYIKNCRSMYYDYFQVLPGPFAKNENQILNLLDREEEWSSQIEYKEKYINFSKKFNSFQDGESGKRLLVYLQHIKKI